MYSATEISVKGLSDVINSTGVINENDNLLTALAKLQNQISAAQSALFAKVPFQSGSLIFKKDEVQEPVWNNYNDKQIRKLSGSTLNAVDAGTYSVIFSLLDGYKWEDDGTLGDRVVQWSIKEATVAKLPSPKSSLLYNGTVQAPEWLDYNSDELALGGFSRATEAGEYTATFIPKKNYVWYDGTTTEKAVKWTIRSSEIEVISSEALPTASATQKGGVKIGTGLAMNGEILNCTVSSGTLAVATSSANGLMSSADKNKLDGITSAIQYKGSVNSFDELPENASVGDVYTIRTTGGTDINGAEVQKNDNVARTSEGWNIFSSSVDLSCYVLKDGSKVLSTNDFTNEDKQKLDELNTFVILGTEESTVNGAMWVVY